MKYEKYISSTGLGLLPQKQRMDHLKEVLKKRMVSLKEIGLSHREALKLAVLGNADGGMPDYRHRSYTGDVYPEPLTEPPVFEFTNTLSNEEGQNVIDDYLRRYPKPQRWSIDDE